MAKPKPTKEELLAKMNQNHNDKLSIDRDNRCVPIAIEILKEATSHAEIGKSIGFQADDKSHKEVSKHMQLFMINKFLDNGIKVSDVGYIFRLCTSVTDLLQEIMKINLEENLKRADTFIWGKEQREITFQDLHAVLEQAVSKLEADKANEPTPEAKEEFVAEEHALDKTEESVAEPVEEVAETVDEVKEETV